MRRVAEIVLFISLLGMAISCVAGITAAVKQDTAKPTWYFWDSVERTATGFACFFFLVLLVSLETAMETA